MTIRHPTTMTILTLVDIVIIIVAIIIIAASLIITIIGVNPWGLGGVATPDFGLGGGRGVAGGRGGSWTGREII